jgi:HEAT repeat protein
MQDHIRPRNENPVSEYPASIFDNLMGALYQVATVTKSGKSIPALINTLHTDETTYYRRLAAFALGHIDWDPRVVDALIVALNDEKRPFRPAGGGLLTPNAVSVQERAVLALLQIGDEHGLAAVIPVVGKSTKFADLTDIEYSGKDSAVLLTKIGKKAPHLLEDALEKRDKEDLRKDIVKNVGELTIIDQVEKALDQINK